MIELFSAPTSNGMRAKIMLDECGLPYQLRRIDLANGENSGAEFMELNPMGLIPVIIDQDGPAHKPLKIAQSIAILLYLGEKSKKYVPTDTNSYATFYDALMNVATDVSMSFSAILALSRSAQPHRDSQSVFERRLSHYLSVWNKNLSRHEYCVGDEITIVDFALFTVILRCNQLMPELIKGHSHLVRWEKLIGNRPGVRKGINFN
jgi:GST-like protein